MSQLSVKSINCHYESQSVIQNLSLELGKNEILALLGPSGCGKTTLLKAIAGLQPISEGEIYISDRKVNSKEFSMPSEQRKIGMIFQDYALFPHLTAAQNVAFGIRHLNDEDKTTRVNEMLALVGLSEYAARFPHELSGGQQQRVAIARAIAYQPDLILLDEPFSNIDNQSRETLMPEIRSILKYQKVSGLLVTHSKDEAFAFADKIAIFQNGRLAQLGTAEELYYSPNSQFVADFIGKTNYLPITKIDTLGVETPAGFVQSLQPIDQTKPYSHIMLRPEQINMQPEKEGLFQIKQKDFCGHYWRYRLTHRDNSDISLTSYSQEDWPASSSIHVKFPVHELVVLNL